MLGTCTSTSGQRRSAGQDEQAGAGSGSALPCRRDPDLWFAETPAELERAKALCGDCPIRAECLAGARAREEPWGVWGGEIFERGEVVARKRPRGRPRKHPVSDVTAANAGGAATTSSGAERVA